MKNLLGPGMVLALLMLAVSPMPLGAWPVDGYPQTGIRRLEEPRLIAAGELKAWLAIGEGSQGYGGFPGSGFADQPQDLASFDVE